VQLLGGGDHDDDDVGALCGSERRLGRHGHVGQGLTGIRAEVEGGDGEAGFGRGAGHGGADGAQADPGDGRGGGHGKLLGSTGGRPWGRRWRPGRTRGRAGGWVRGGPRVGGGAGAGGGGLGGAGRGPQRATAAVRVSTTSARACSPPTLPGKTTYGMPMTSSGA